MQARRRRQERRGWATRERAARERAARERADLGWTALRLESHRRFQLVRAWLGSVPPAALATARSGALVDAALLLAQSLRRAA
jgi:hypothetical protein